MSDSENGTVMKWEWKHGGTSFKINILPLLSCELLWEVGQDLPSQLSSSYYISQWFWRAVGAR